MEEKGKGKALMSQLLGVMKNQFNRGEGDSDKNSSATDSHDDSEAGRRSLRSQNPKSGDEASDSPELKRSTRRSNQKGSGGSILQSAIARKEKSYSVSTPPSTSASSASKSVRLAIAKKKPMSLPAKTPPPLTPTSLLKKKVPKAAESVSSTTSEISTASLPKEEVLMESEDSESIISVKTEEEIAPPIKPDPVVPSSAEKKRRLVEGGPQDGNIQIIEYQGQYFYKLVNFQLQPILKKMLASVWEKQLGMEIAGIPHLKEEPHPKPSLDQTPT